MPYARVIRGSKRILAAQNKVALKSMVSVESTDLYFTLDCVRIFLEPLGFAHLQVEIGENRKPQRGVRVCK